MLGWGVAKTTLALSGKVTKCLVGDARIAGLNYFDSRALDSNYVTLAQIKLELLSECGTNECTIHRFIEFFVEHRYCIGAFSRILKHSL